MGEQEIGRLLEQVRLLKAKKENLVKLVQPEKQAMTRETEMIKHMKNQLRVLHNAVVISCLEDKLKLAQLSTDPMVLLLPTLLLHTPLQAPKFLLLALIGRCSPRVRLLREEKRHAGAEELLMVCAKLTMMHKHSKTAKTPPRLQPARARSSWL